MNYSEISSNIDSSPIVGNLKELSGIQFKKVNKTSDEAVWDYLVAIYHYLGYKKMFGRRIKYLIMRTNYSCD